MKAKSCKNFIIHTGILALQFLICGSVYISQIFHLYNFYSVNTAIIIALRWNYLAQAFGMLIFIMLFLTVPKLAGNRISFSLLMAVSTVVLIISLLSNNSIISVVLIITYNVIIGLSSGYCLTMLTAHISKRNLGIAFGIAYAFGSVGTYLISLLDKGGFLQSRNVIIVYVLINVIILFILYYSKDIPSAVSEKSLNGAKTVIYSREKLQFYFLIILLLILVNTISSLGGSYQVSVLDNAKANIPFSRAFYAVGLTCAGLISRKSRKYLALTTFASLSYPVVSVILAGDAAVATILLTVSYIFLGFVSVYRSLSAMDIAAENNSLLAYACSGLMLSRIVEASSTWYSNIVTTDKILSSIIFTVLFALLIFIFFMYFQKAYYPAVSYETSKEDQLLSFSQRYNMTSREKEVFQLLIKGTPNREIAALMYITDNTVKFHVKNLLKKTNCLNRVDLVKLYDTENNHDINN